MSVLPTANHEGGVVVAGRGDGCEKGEGVIGAFGEGEVWNVEERWYYNGS